MLAATAARAASLRIRGGSGRADAGLGDARGSRAPLVVGADAIFLDGFAPDRNPEMWEPKLIKDVARCARPDALLATYTSARPVREALEAAGFNVELRSGYGGKRHEPGGALRAALRREKT